MSSVWNEQLVMSDNMYQYVTRHEKTSLMYTSNLMTFLDFQTLITLSNKFFIIYSAFHRKSHAAYRFPKPYPVKEIYTVI